MARNKNLSNDLKAQPWVFKNLYFNDFMFLVIFISFSVVIMQGIIAPVLQIPFLIFSIITALWLISKCFFNETRKNYEMILIYLTRSKRAYRHYDYVEGNVHAPKES